MSNYNVNLTDTTDTRQVNVNVTTGDKGWSPELVMVRRESDGALVALREWIGGSGEKPTPPQYVAEDGFTDDIEEAVNFQGDKGDKPNHEWIGYSLRFELPNGDWGIATDLRGEKGEKGEQGEQGEVDWDRVDFEIIAAVSAEEERAKLVEGNLEYQISTKAGLDIINSPVNITYSDLVSNEYTNPSFKNQTVAIFYKNPTTLDSATATFDSNGVLTMPFSAVSGMTATIIGITGSLVKDKDLYGFSLDFSETEVGGINNTTGADRSTTTYNRTNYIPCKAGDFINYSVRAHTFNAIFFYDEDKALLSSALYIVPATTVTGTIQVPQGASFLRVQSMNNTDIYYEDYTFSISVLSVRDTVNALAENVEKLNVDVFGIDIPYTDLKPGGLTSVGVANDTSTNSRTPQPTPIPESLEGHELHYSILIATSGFDNIFFYDENMELISSHVRATGSGVVYRQGSIKIPQGARFFWAKTINDSHPDWVFYEYYLRIDGVRKQLQELNESYDNLDYDVNGLHFTFDDLVVGGLTSTGANNSTSTNSRFPTYVTIPEILRGGFLYYSILAPGTGSEHLFFFDDENNLLLSTLSYDNPNHSTILSGRVEIPLNATKFRIKTLNDTSPLYQPYTFGVGIYSLRDDVNYLLKEDKRNVYFESMVATAKRYVKHQTSSQRTGLPNFNMIFYTDPHFNETNVEKNFTELINFTKNPQIAPWLDYVQCGGDITNGTSGRSKTTTLDETNKFISYALEFDVVNGYSKGNHDDNVNWDTAGSDPNSVARAITDEELYNIIVKPLAEKFPQLQTVENKLYSRIDFDDKKVTHISLNPYELPFVDSGTGTQKYPIRSGKYYSQDQLDWLYTQLNSIPNDYTLIITNHAPPIVGYSIGTWMQGGNPVGKNLIPSIIDAWQKGTVFSHDYTNATYPELNTSKVFDFTSRGEGIFAFILCGHTHSFDITQCEDFPDIKVIITPCLCTRDSGSTGSHTDLYNAGKAPLLIRSDDDYGRNSFNIISIDTTRRKAAIITYGACIDSGGKIKDAVNFVEY